MMGAVRLNLVHQNNKLKGLQAAELVAVFDGFITVTKTVTQWSADLNAAVF